MRILLVAAVAPVLLLTGCSCHKEDIVTDCQVTGQLTDQTANLTYVSTGLASDVICSSDSFSFARTGELTAPRDLKLAVRFHVRDATRAAPTDGTFPFVQFKLTVRDVPFGPSEIELDDTRAEVEGCNGLHGHLGITSLTPNCHDSLYCPIDLQGTLSFSAVSLTDGSVLNLTNASVNIHQTYVKRDVMCGGDGLGA
jgi:hypothetical protein